MSASAMTSETANRPPGRRTRAASAKTLRLVPREVYDAIRDHDVDGGVRERDLLDRPLQPLDVVGARAALVLACEIEHLVGHIDPIGLAGRPHPTGREQHVDATARTEVENRLALVELGDRGRVAAPQGRELCLLGELAALLDRVELIPKYLLVGLARASAGRVGRAAASGVGRAHAPRGGGVAIANALTDLIGRSSCRQPPAQLLQRLGVDVVVSPQALALGSHDPGLAKHLEVMRDGGL